MLSTTILIFLSLSMFTLPILEGILIALFDIKRKWGKKKMKRFERQRRKKMESKLKINKHTHTHKTMCNSNHPLCIYSYLHYPNFHHPPILSFISFLSSHLLSSLLYLFCFAFHVQYTHTHTHTHSSKHKHTSRQINPPYI